jgi:hypothetical protein
MTIRRTAYLADDDELAGDVPARPVGALRHVLARVSMVQPNGVAVVLVGFSRIDRAMSQPGQRPPTDTGAACENPKGWTAPNPSRVNPAAVAGVLFDIRSKSRAMFQCG